MKNKFKLLSTIMMALTIVGCSCDNTINTTLKNPTSIVSGDKLSQEFTTQTIYDYLKTNAPTQYNKVFIKKLVKIILEEKSGYTKGEFEEVYNYKLKKYFEDNFINGDEFKVNGQFDEELLVATLKSQMFRIGNPNSNGTGKLDELNLGLRYDYSSYIEEVVDYKIYMELLIEDYISNSRSSILDNSKTRIITVYSADDFEDMEEITKDLFDGKYADLSKLEETKKNEAKKELGRQYCENLGKPNDYYTDENGKKIESCSPSKSSYDSSFSKFTTCENGKSCDLKKGFEYQIEQVDKTVYLKEQVVNKDSTDVLFENAFSQLLRSDIKNYLLSDNKMDEIFEDGYANYGKFMINNKADFANLNSKSIILSEGPDKDCYIVLVKVIDSKTTDASIADKQKAFSLLRDKVNETSVLIHYVEKMEVDLYDSDLKAAYEGIIG